MAITVAQTAAQMPLTNEHAVTATFAGATVVGNVLVAVVAAYGAITTAGLVVTDSKGNTWAQDYASPAIGSGMYAILCSTTLTVAGAAHSVTFEGGAGATMIANLTVIEAVGMTSTGRFDAAVRAIATSAPPYTAGPTGTLAQGDELVLAMVSVDSGETAATLTQDPTWGLASEQENGTGYVGSVVYKAVAATTPLSHVWAGTYASAPWLTVVASYKAAAVAGGVTGTVAVTEAGDVAGLVGAFTAAGVIAGAVAVTEIADAVVIVGTAAAPTTFFGPVVAVEADDAATIVGTVATGPVIGTVAAIEATDTPVIVGFIPGAPTASGPPYIVDVATVLPTLVVSVSLAGNVTPPAPVTGTLAVTEVGDVTALVGAFTAAGVIAGAVAVTEPTDTATLVGTFTASGPTVLLFDDFTGTTVDTSKWIVYDRISDQVNGERNCCVPANVTVASSRLLITARTETYTCQDHAPASPSTAGPTEMLFTSGQISQVMPSFLYGTVDFRAKIPPGTAGTWPCMWMLGDGWKASQPFTANTPDGFDNWPTGIWWEIDVAEFMNNSRGNYSCTVHYPTAGGNLADVPANPTDRFMVYRLVWQAGRARFYIDPEDGRGFLLMADYNNPAGVPNTPGYVTINCPVGGKGGVINGDNLPQSLEIDYVRITQP